MDSDAIHRSAIEPLVQLGGARALLAACDLMTDDVVPSPGRYFYGCRRGEKLVGVVGLEQAGRVALLRSLVVVPGARQSGIGKALTAHAEAVAATAGTAHLYLLTLDAVPYFSALGYRVEPRDSAPPAIRTTGQFSSLCPASATLMVKWLPGNSRRA